MPSPKKISPDEFEQLAYEVTSGCATGTSFEGKIRRTASGVFPDIVDDEFFGVEVKSTTSDKWQSFGNSVMESTRVPTADRIYVLFGKLGGEPDVIVKKYEECLSEIKVTHSPRYQIDMRLNPGETILEKMGTSYDELRTQTEPIKSIREYYKKLLKPGQSLWWMGDTLDESTAPPIIKNYSELSREEKNQIMAEAMIMFPEIFSGTQKKYQRLAAYLAASHSVVSPNLRDEFSAGGVYKINRDGTELIFPHVVGEMIDLKEKIKEFLSTQNEETLSDHWQKKIVNYEDPTSAWLKELDEQSSDIKHDLKLSDLFNNNSD